MRKNKSTAVLAVLITVFSLAAIVVFTGELPPQLDARMHSDIGHALAQDAIKLLGPGGHLIVITRDTVTFPQPSLDLVLAAIRKEVRQSGVSIAAVHPLQVDPLRPMQVPPGDFVEFIRRAVPGDVIVSLMGPPALTEEQMDRLGSIQPKIVAFCPGLMSDTAELRPLVERGLLHAALLSRPSKQAGVTHPARERESFDELYVRASRSDLTQLPAPGAQP